jgi:hypothetical protein
MSENTGSVGKRTVASGAVIFAANIYAVCENTICFLSEGVFDLFIMSQGPRRYTRQTTRHVFTSLPKTCIL